MFTSKYLLALVGCGLVSAQTNTLCAQATVTIANQVDATNLASCPTLNTVVIASTTANDITINGVQSISNLNATGATMLTSITAPQLTTISGFFTLQGLTIMGNLAMPRLSSVGAIMWDNLPALQSLAAFTTGVTTAGSVSIQDTSLTSLTGINVASTGSYVIAANSGLRTISSGLQKVNTLAINSNGPNMEVSFPSLTTVIDASFVAVNSLSLPVLSTVNGTFQLQESSITSFSAPNLTSVAATFSFQNDTGLTAISAPKLTTVNALTINANPQLMNISGFPALSQIKGAVNVVGNYSTFVLPVLASVGGTFNAQSSGNFSCIPYTTLNTNKFVAGQFQCTPNSGNVQSSVGTGDATGTAPAASATKTGGAVGSYKPMNIFPMVVMTALVGSLIMLGGALCIAM